MATNHLPPILWEKTKWPEEELPKQEWWDVLPHKFVQLCIVKARIIEISLLSEENFQKLRNFSLDDLYEAIFEDAYILVEWLPRSDLPQELLSNNRVELCVYDCGTFNTAKRTFDSSGNIEEPFIHGFWNNPWSAFCKDDIVLIGYDSQSKGPNGQNIPLLLRLILLGHSNYTGIDGEDNSFSIPAKCGAEAFLPVMPDQPTGKALVAANNYIRLISLFDDQGNPTAPDVFEISYEFPMVNWHSQWYIDYRTGMKKCIKPVGQIISAPPDENDRKDLYFHATIELYSTCLRNSGSSNADMTVSSPTAAQIHPGEEYFSWSYIISEYQHTYNYVPYLLQVNTENNDLFWSILSESWGGPSTSVNPLSPNYNRILHYTYNEQTNSYDAELYSSTRNGLAHVHHDARCTIDELEHIQYHVTHNISFQYPSTTVVFNGANSVSYQFSGTHNHDIGLNKYSHYDSADEKWVYDYAQWYGSGANINTSGSVTISDQFGVHTIDIHSNIYRNVSHEPVPPGALLDGQCPITFNIDEKIIYFIEVDLTKCFYCWLELSANINGTIDDEDDYNNTKLCCITAKVKTLYKGQESTIAESDFYVDIVKYCLAYIYSYGFTQFPYVDQTCWGDYFVYNDPDYVNNWWMSQSTNNYTFYLHGQCLFATFFELIRYMVDDLWGFGDDPSRNLGHKTIFITEGKGYISRGLYESDIGHIGVYKMLSILGGVYEYYLFYKGKYIGKFDDTNFGENNCGYIPIPED